MERLGKSLAISDGFLLAEEDLRVRGPGEYVGVQAERFPRFQDGGSARRGFVEIGQEGCRRAAGAGPELGRTGACGCSRPAGRAE